MFNFRFLAISAMMILLVFIVPSCKKNKAPYMPSTPSGPSSGSINTEYTFTSLAEDPEEDSIAIRFDWGDGDTSNWSSYVASAETVTMNHSYSHADTYYVKAQAKDEYDFISSWSEAHSIVICPIPGWTFGGLYDDMGYSVQQTQDGGYIIAGFTDSYGAGYSDIYLIKTDGNGNQQWYKTFGGTNWDWGYSVQLTQDGGYIIVGLTYSFGAGDGDVFLIKTDGNGNLVWTKTIGGSDYACGRSIQHTSDGGYIITGCINPPINSKNDVYLIKTDANGDTIWTRTFGGSDFDDGNSVQQTTDGGYIIVGYTKSFGAGERDVYLIKTDANGDTVWTKTYGGTYDDHGYSVLQIPDGGYIIVGYTKSFCADEEDVYFIKTDTNGNAVLTKTFSAGDQDAGYSVQQTQDGGYIIAGFTEGDIYLIKTDENGNQQWYKTLGGPDSDEGYSVQLTSDGGYIIVGNTRSFGACGYDVYLIKTDANGNVE